MNSRIHHGRFSIPTMVVCEMPPPRRSQHYFELFEVWSPTLDLLACVLVRAVPGNG